MIRARGLARRFTTKYGPVEAVKGVDITVEAGELVGFLGPNGAGKTTTLRMLTTLLEPTAGSATVAGHDLRADPVGVRRAIGYVAQGASLAFGYPVDEELEMQARFYGLSAKRARLRCAELLGQLELGGLEKRTTDALSGGQLRRLEIAMGLVHRPALLFLDEPTAGLDPQGRANLWQHVRTLRAEHGMTVFLTTHYLDEADALCDRLLVIDNGAIVAEGSPDELKRSVSGDSVTMTVNGVPDAAAVAAQVASTLPGAHEITVDEATVRFRTPHGDGTLPGLLRGLGEREVALAALSVQRPTLDDVFLTITGRSLRETETSGSGHAA